MNIFIPNQPSTPDDNRYSNFIVFEPASQRIQEQDILIRGPEILPLFEEVYAKINMSSELKLLILNNRLAKIRQMLEMLKSPDELILTKFFDKVWRRYAYVSNIGELFLGLPSFVEFLPHYQDTKKDLYALRLDDLDDSDDTDDDDDENEDTDSEENDEDVESKLKKDDEPADFPEA